MRKLVILLIFAPVISFGQIQSFFGEKFTVTETKDLINLQDNIQIKGEIKSTCKMKGCWMELDVEEKTIFVRFKDYSFFVPKEGAEGKLAVVNGKLSIGVL